jgi:hypothetical protein
MKPQLGDCDPKSEGSGPQVRRSIGGRFHVAYIRTVDRPDDPFLAKLYEANADPKGRVASVVKIFSLKPRLLEVFFDLGGVTTFGGTSLGRRREEMLSSYVSYLNRCFY